MFFGGERERVENWFEGHRSRGGGGADQSPSPTGQYRLKIDHSTPRTAASEKF